MKLNPFVTISLGFLLITSCQTGDQKGSSTAPTPPSSVTAPAQSKEEDGLPFTLQYNTESNRFNILENKAIHPQDEEELVRALNAKYPEIKIKIDKKSNDTLFVSIPDATYLTQSIGITGATSYLIEATYGFTALKGIHVVNYSFIEGDHALPGPYTRTSFTEFFD